MGRLINTTAMTVDGVVDVSDWFVAHGEHDEASLSLFADDASMLLGRKTYEGLAAFWPTQSGRWADRLNAIPRELIRATLVDEILFWIHPRIQGSGTRPYEGATVPVRLLEAKPFDSGVTLLRYQPIAHRNPRTSEETS